MVIYTDARGSGYVGEAVFFRCEQIVYHSHLPDWGPQAFGIYEFELAGVLFGELCAIELERIAPPF